MAPKISAQLKFAHAGWSHAEHRTTTGDAILLPLGHDVEVSAMSYLDRITVNPLVCHGKPTVRGLRMPVQTILELLASGMTSDEVLDDYPYLEREDLLAALEYGAVTAGGHQVTHSGS